MALKALARDKEGIRLKGLLEEALNSIKDMEKPVTLLKDKFMGASDQYFERENE